MPIQGLFNINIPRRANKVSFESLSDEEQKQLVGNDQLDLDNHELFEVSIVPEIKMLEKARIPWSKKKLCYEYVDRVLVHADLSHAEEMVLIGILPTSESVEGQKSLDLESAELSVFDKLKFKLVGAFKNVVKKSTHNLFAHRHRSFAQWIFLKNYINNVSDYTLRIFFSAPATLSASERYVKIDVDFQDDGRSIKRARNRIVHLT